MITQVLNRLKLWQKIGWLVLAMAIPAALIGFFYLRLADSQVSQAREELDGARYLQGLGAVEGEILDAPRGAGGFGYDPLFYFPAFGCTFGEASEAQKLSVSHRGQAFRKMLKDLHR